MPGAALHAALPESVAASPAGRQLGWLLACLDDPALATAAAAGPRLSGAALAATSAEDFAAALRGLAAELGGVTVERADAPGPFEAAARLVTAAGRGWLLRCAVDERPPHGIAATSLVPARLPAAGGCSAPVPWAAVAGPEPAGGGTLAPELAERVDAELAGLREELRLPGLLAGVVRGGALEHWVALGHAEVATRRRPGRRTALRLGSLSTVPTALAVHRLAAEGRLTLDDPVAAHLRSIRLTPAARGGPVLVRHLLTHTGGLAADPRRPAGVPAGAPVPELAELYRPAVVAAAPPGERAVHSADGYALLGQLVADVSGRPFPDYAAAEVLDPLGLRRTSYLLDARVARQPLCGYDVDFDEVTVAPGSEVVLRPAAGAATTLDDLARLAAVLCAPERAAGVVAPADHPGLTRPAAATGPAAEVSLAGLTCGRLAGTPIAWQAGGWPGALAGLWVAPGADVGVVVAANAFSPARLARLAEAGALLLALLLGALR